MKLKKYKELRLLSKPIIPTYTYHCWRTGSRMIAGVEYYILKIFDNPGHYVDVVKVVIATGAKKKNQREITIPKGWI